MQIRLITLVVLTVLAGAMLPLWMAVWHLVFDAPPIDSTMAIARATPVGGLTSVIMIFFACFFLADCLVFIFIVGWFLERRMERHETEEAICAIQSAASSERNDDA